MKVPQLDWTEKAAIDYAVGMIGHRATKIYISDPTKFNAIREAINCSLERLEKLMRVVAEEAENGRDCPPGWCDDGNGGCDWCDNGNGNGEPRSAQ